MAERTGRWLHNPAAEPAEIFLIGAIGMNVKRQEDSLAVSAQLVLPQQANPAGNIHGGEIMKMMDNTAAIAAMRHSNSNVVTARVDELVFKKPIRIGEYVTCSGRVVYAGNSSMEVFVTIEAENLRTGKRQIALTAFFTMVAVDDNDRPSPVPQILPGDDEFSRGLFEIGRRRYSENRRERNKHVTPNPQKQ